MLSIDVIRVFCSLSAISVLLLIQHKEKHQGLEHVFNVCEDIT